MNKIRGSVIAKMIAWILCIGSALGTAAFGFLTLAGIGSGYYNMTREEMLAEEFRNINAWYSLDAYQNMKNHRNQKNLTQEGFRYGIFQTDDLAKVDFGDKTLYMDTNMTDDDLKSLDKNKVFLYQIRQFVTGGQDGQAYGYVEDWENLSDLQSITSDFGEQGDFVWRSQYADAVCFDTEKGIFYYLSEDKYYPVREVTMYYENNFGFLNEYYYSYDDEAGKYRLNYSNNEYTVMYEGNGEWAEEDIVTENQMDEETVAEAWNATSVEDDIDHFLKGDKEKYVDFAALNKTKLDYSQWGTLLLDNVREIQGEELTVIDSKRIAKTAFIDLNTSPEYYLDENYTLHVAQEIEEASYWVASLVPDSSTLLTSNSRYYMSAWAVDLLYSYGRNACVLAISFAIMTLVSFVFLVYACGYRKDREGIVLTWFDRLPLEIISAAAFFSELMLMSMVYAILYNLNNREIRNTIQAFVPLVLSAAVLMCAVALWYMLSLCVRFKYGKWWRNSICYKVWSVVKSVLLSIFRNISLLWKLLLFLIVKAFIEFVLLLSEAWGAFIMFWLVETFLLGMVAVHLVLQMNGLQKAAKEMADGNLGYKVKTDRMFYGCRVHGENLNKIGDGLSKAVDERMKSERFKTELITNVSHDIKTPLTSIINYVDLLEKEELHNEKAEEYLDVLERQSSKLKKLIEDLVEASKASTGNLEVGKELLEAGVFLTQTVGEFEEKLSFSGLELIVKKPEEPVYISADGRHLWRVVDNLMNNICKYAQPSSRVYVNLEKENDSAVIIFRNISKYQLNMNGDALMERFIRGDSSRNTEGHGLGLSIAKSLMDLMGGGMEITVDGDLFKVRLCFPLEKPSEEFLRDYDETRHHDEIRHEKEGEDDIKNEK